MKRIEMSRLFFLFIGITIVIGAMVSCDNSTEPGEEPEEHLFYIAPEIGNMVKVFSVEQEAIIDSFRVDSVTEESAMRIHVIGDDSLLAASAGPRTYLVDLETKEIVGSFAARDPVFSPDSRFYYSYEPEGLWRFPEHSRVSEEVSGASFVSFDSQSEVMSYIFFDQEIGGLWPGLGFYSIIGDTVINTFKYSQGSMVTILLSYPISTLNKTFISGAGADGYYFAVTDLDSDTVRPLKYFDIYAGVVPVVTPDEKYAFFSDIGVQGFGFIPSEHIFVYDTDTEDSVASIPYEEIDEAGYMVITYDSKYLLACPYNERNDVTVVCLIDAVNFKVIGTYDCGFLPGHVSSKYCTRNGA